MATTIWVNGEKTVIDAPEDTPLVWALREHVGLTGTKFSCGIAYCGACTVHLDGQAARSCQIRLGDIGGSDVTTIEGAIGKAAEAVVGAWRALDVVQCGYCQSGQIMQAIDLLQRNPKPSDSDIDAAMGGNVCRCATYQRIRQAIHRAAEVMEG